MRLRRKKRDHVHSFKRANYYWPDGNLAGSGVLCPECGAVDPSSLWGIRHGGMRIEVVDR